MGMAGVGSHRARPDGGAAGATWATDRYPVRNIGQRADRLVAPHSNHAHEEGARCWT